MENHEPHPHLAHLYRQYARDLAETTPSKDLDARIDQLVAEQRTNIFPLPARVRWVPFYAAAAGFAALAAGLGMFIGMRVEHARTVSAASEADAAWPPADLTMWPTDSVALKIPAEFSSHGTLVAVDGKSRKAGTRYWVDIVVSNDGTVRIENIVPAGEEKHGITTQTP